MFIGRLQPVKHCLGLTKNLLQRIKNPRDYTILINWV